jgi:hypothetical protein
MSEYTFLYIKQCWSCSQQFQQSWGSMTQSLCLILSVMEINMWFFFGVCEEVGKVLLRIHEGTGTIWKN